MEAGDFGRLMKTMKKSFFLALWLAVFAAFLCTAWTGASMRLTEFAPVFREVTTTDGTQAHMEHPANVPDNSVCHVEAVVTARDPNADNVKAFDLIAVIKRTSGGDAVIAGFVLNVPQGDAAALLWSATVTVSGAKFRVSVTGLAGVTIDWGCRIYVVADTE